MKDEDFEALVLKTQTYVLEQIRKHMDNHFGGKPGEKYEIDLTGFTQRTTEDYFMSTFDITSIVIVPELIRQVAEKTLEEVRALVLEKSQEKMFDSAYIKVVEIREE